MFYSASITNLNDNVIAVMVLFADDKSHAHFTAGQFWNSEFETPGLVSEVGEPDGETRDWFLTKYRSWDSSEPLVVWYHKDVV